MQIRGTITSGLIIVFAVCFMAGCVETSRHGNGTSVAAKPSESLSSEQSEVRKGEANGSKDGGLLWDNTRWHFDSDAERLFVNSEGDLEWTPKGGDQFFTRIPAQSLSSVGDIVEKSYMFMSDGAHKCPDCMKCPGCFDDDITCIAGTSDFRIGLFESSGSGNGVVGYKGYNFRFGPNMMAGPTRWVDCTREVHKTGMFGKKPVNSSNLMSKNSGLMGRIPGFELAPGKYSLLNVRLERISATSVLLSMTLNDKTVGYTDDSGKDQPEKIDIFAMSMRNKRPYTRVVLRSVQKGPLSQ